MDQERLTAELLEDRMRLNHPGMLDYLEARGETKQFFQEQAEIANRWLDEELAATG